MPTQYLDLTNNLLRRLNEVVIPQADFASVRGVQALAKDAINASIEQILQYEYRWPFNTSTKTQVLAQGTIDYSWPTDLQIVDWRSFAISRDDTINIHGQPLLFISRDRWFKMFKADDDYSGTDGISIPYYVFEKHGTGFSVSPSPNLAYTVTYDYWKVNTALSTYDTVSTIPSNFDEVIIQGGIYHIYMLRDNQSQAQMAEDRFMKALQHMRTLLINKEDRVRPPFVIRGSGMNLGMSQLAEPLYPLV